MLKEDGGPNFNPGGKFFTEDGDSDEYGTLALGFPIAAATIQNTKFMYTFVQQHSKLKLVGTYIIQAATGPWNESSQGPCDQWVCMAVYKAGISGVTIVSKLERYNQGL